jgi:hypothetical protein
MSEVLEETIQFLMQQPGVAEREVRFVHLNNYFTVVELDDTSVGACMSSFRISVEDLAEKQRAIHSQLEKDPLLFNTTHPHAISDGLAGSIRAAVANALSAPLLRAGEDQFFTSTNDFPSHFFVGVEYAVVIGFGGYLDYLVRKTNVERLHVSDLSYGSRRERMEQTLTRYRRMRRDVKFSISDGTDSATHLKKADFVSITGSTLTNGTFDDLIAECQSCKKVVLQGQSASIHPKKLFESGIQLVATTLKNRSIAKAAFWDPTGDTLRPFLEGGLPSIYLWPNQAGQKMAI